MSYFRKLGATTLAEMVKPLHPDFTKSELDRTKMPPIKAMAGRCSNDWTEDGRGECCHCREFGGCDNWKALRLAYLCRRQYP